MTYTIPDSVLEAIATPRSDAAFEDTPNPYLEFAGDRASRQDATTPNLGLPYDTFTYREPELDREEFADQPWAYRFVPQSTLRAPGAQVIERVRSTYTAVWQLAADYKNNLARSDVSFQTIRYGNHRFQTTFDYTTLDQDRSNLTNANNGFRIDIVQERKYAVRESWVQLKNQLFSVGQPERGIFGAITHPDVPRAYSTFRPDLDSGADDNLKLLIRSEARIGRRTNQRELATTVIFPPDIYRELSQQPYILLGGSSVSRTTLEQFLHASVSIKEADMANELEGAGPNGEDVILFFTRRPDKLYAMTPLEYRENAPTRGIGKQTVLCEGEVSGVHYRRPFSAEVLLVPAAS